MNNAITITVDDTVPLRTLMQGLRYSGLTLTFSITPIERPTIPPGNMPIYNPSPRKAAKKATPAKATPAVPAESAPAKSAKTTAGSAVSAYWARMTPEERSAEIKRRQDVRDGKKPKKAVSKTPAKKGSK